MENPRGRLEKLSAQGSPAESARAILETARAIHAQFVIPGRAKREPGIPRLTCEFYNFEIPGLALRAIPE